MPGIGFNNRLPGSIGKPVDEYENSSYTFAMLRTFVAACSLLLISHISRAIAADALRPFRFAEVKRIREVSGLPPKLRIVFDLMCNEKFLKVIRHDKTDPKTGKITIAVGALVEEEPLSNCAGESKEREVSAGKTFSGREYSISLIKR